MDPWSVEGPHLLLLLPGQLHLLLLLLEEHGGHVLLLRVRRQQLVPQRGQLVDHHQQLQLLLCQALLGSWGRKKLGWVRVRGWERGESWQHKVGWRWFCLRSGILISFD